MSTSFVKCQIRRVHVVVVQWTSNKCSKKHDACAELLFWSLNLLLFWSRRCGRRRSCLSYLLSRNVYLWYQYCEIKSYELNKLNHRYGSENENCTLEMYEIYSTITRQMILNIIKEMTNGINLTFAKPVDLLLSITLQFLSFSLLFHFLHLFSLSFFYIYSFF